MNTSTFHSILRICAYLFFLALSFPPLSAQNSKTENDLQSTSWKDQLSKLSLAMPLDIPIYLAGNFCELRPNHFHGGIDIKTQGKSGLKVYASDDGYISRIKVSPYGYGKAIYIHHPKTGLTTVYAHLSKFELKFSKYIKQLQYQKKSFALDINPKTEEFPISKGQFIAFSGNSGGSHAPHLHYEIRESKNQEPINPLYYPFDIKDHIAPEINGLVNYKLDPENVYSIVGFNSYKLSKLGNDYSIKDTIKVPLITSFGIKCYDRSDGMRNLNGVYEVQMTVDDIPYFSFKMDQFAFSESRYINSFIDYKLYKENKGRFVKCFVEPMNKLSIYPEVKDSGILKLQKDSIYNVHYTVKDNHGNVSYLEFTMQATEQTHCIPDPSLYKALCGQKNHFRFQGASLQLPANALYSNQQLDLAKIDTVKNAVTASFSIHKNTSPLHGKAILNLPFLNNMDKTLKQKSCLMKLKENGEWTAINSQVKEKSISGKIKEFGIYAAFLDTVSPTIELVNIYQDKNMAERISIRVKATDKISGIKSYNGYIDGEWVLVEYDAKNDLFIYNFEKGPKGIKHLFEFHVNDKRDNKSVIRINYIR